MAQFPQGFERLEARCRAEERPVLHQLRRCLDDQHLIWHHLPVGEAAQPVDLVVLSPRWGVLLLQVMAPGADRPPIVREQLQTLVGQMAGDARLVHADGHFAGRLRSPCGWGLVMPGPRPRGHDTTPPLPGCAPHRLLHADDLAPELEPRTFERRLHGLYTVHYPHTLDADGLDRLRGHLFPTLRLDGPPASPRTLDGALEAILHRLDDGVRLVHGPAGSGKTRLLLARARQLAATAGSPVLVLCLNRFLADRLSLLLGTTPAAAGLVVRTFHDWCQDMVRQHRLDVPATAHGDEYFAALARTVERALESGRMPSGRHAAVLIDEAQDFEPAWLRTVARLTEPSRPHLLLFCDEAQTLPATLRRRRRGLLDDSDLRSQAEALTLERPLRSPAGVQALLRQLTGAPRPIVTGVPVPELMLARHGTHEAELIAARVLAAREAGRPVQDMLVLCRAPYLMRPIEHALQQRGVAVQSMASPGWRQFDWNAPSLKLMTMAAARGLEAGLVLVAGLQALAQQDDTPDDTLRVLGMALTRCTDTLVLSAHGHSPWIERVAAALEAAAQGREIECRP